MPNARQQGFTLIEMSIVLVIIGLIVGGVLVGQSLINAAAVRAQISQIEKFNTAVNTFWGKYGYLPGDIKDPDASSFGFQARGLNPGQGDGNSVIEGTDGTPTGHSGGREGAGETVMFWVDLSTAGLIDGSFNAASPTVPAALLTTSSSPALSAFFPPGKVGQGNYVYIWSGGISGSSSSANDSLNYFGLSSITQWSSAGGLAANPGLTVQQAYSIDTKIDDGLPQSGRAMATYYLGSPRWADAPYNGGQSAPGNAIAPASASCYDNGNNAANPMQYSIAQSNGSGVNCALSFRFQ